MAWAARTRTRRDSSSRPTPPAGPPPAPRPGRAATCRPASPLANPARPAARTGRPIAGLSQGLRRRGLLDQPLIVWGGEFGRQPTAEFEKGTGRDHNSYGFTMWLAGGGIKGGTSVGRTD